MDFITTSGCSSKTSFTIEKFSFIDARAKISPGSMKGTEKIKDAVGIEYWKLELPYACMDYSWFQFSELLWVMFWNLRV